jgi:hypothetical protein
MTRAVRTVKYTIPTDGTFATTIDMEGYNHLAVQVPPMAGFFDSDAATLTVECRPVATYTILVPDGTNAPIVTSQDGTYQSVLKTDTTLGRTINTAGINVIPEGAYLTGKLRLVSDKTAISDYVGHYILSNM